MSAETKSALEESTTDVPGISSRIKAEEWVAASELPQEAKNLILRIVKRTRLWRQEKSAVAVELIAHFGDGIDAGASLEELQADFGAEGAAARLIRRSKLRCRPLPFRVLRSLAQATACMLVFYLVAMVYYATGSPNVATDYVAKFNASALAVPEEERAWPVYREALLALDHDRAQNVLKLEGIEPVGTTWEEAVRFIEESESALAKTREAAAMAQLGYVRASAIHSEDRELWPQEYENDQLARASRHQSTSDVLWDSSKPPLLTLKLPHLDELRRLSRLLHLDAIHAANLGDGDRALSNVVALLGMARQQYGSPTLIEQLVALDFAMQAVEATARTMRDHPTVFSDRQLVHLAHAFAGDQVVSIMNLEIERTSFQDIVQRVFTDDGRGDGRLTIDGLRKLGELRGALNHSSSLTHKDRVPAIAMAPLANFLSASRKDMTAMHKQIMDDCEATAARPYWEQGDALSQDSWKRLLTSSQKYWLVRLLTPAISRAFAVQQSAVGRRDGVLIALALELHRRREGSYPRSLDALSPDLLPNVPRDRFDGSMVRYRMVGDQAVVYSVGSDLDDDGGVLPYVPKNYWDAPAEGKEDPGAKRNRDQFNERLRNETPRERRERFNRTASPSSGRASRTATPDGDWILWHSAGWQVGPLADPRDDR